MALERDTVARKTYESKDDGENAGLEEQDNHQHGKASPVRTVGTTSIDADSSSNKDHDHSLEDHENDTGLAADVHQSSSSETSSSEETLSDGVEVGTLDMSISDAEVGACLGEVVDEVRGNADLSTDVGELGEGSPEKGVLFAEWLVDVAGGGGSHLSLVGHVGIGDFGNRS